MRRMTGDRHDDCAWDSPLWRRLQATLEVARHASHDSHLSNDSVTFTNKFTSKAVRIALIDSRPVGSEWHPAHTLGLQGANFTYKYIVPCSGLNSPAYSESEKGYPSLSHPARKFNSR